ncbi:MAG: DUF721 domain-containing protein [Nitrospirae bacterium]|nr:DUF721 domain-containing protein [Nitrospirota bacterium]
MATGPSFDSVASILRSVLRRHGLGTKLLEYRLQQRWPEIAGEQIATHTRPDQIRFKKLYLIVDNSVWLQQLTFLKPALLEKIHAAAGSLEGQGVTDIVFRVGEVSSARTLGEVMANAPSHQKRREAPP